MTGKRAIWLAICGTASLIAALIWFAVVSPVLAWRSDQQQQLVETEKSVARIARSIAALQLEKSDLASEIKFDGLWRAETLGEATALVQASLGERAREQGIALRSISPLQVPQIDLVDTVGFRIEGEVHLDGLVALLEEVEFGTPLLMIERVNLRRLARNNVDSVQPSVFFQVDIVAPVILPGDGA